MGATNAKNPMDRGYRRHAFCCGGSMGYLDLGHAKRTVRRCIQQTAIRHP
jgi:hypothetical protein